MGQVRRIIKEEVKRFLVENMRKAYAKFYEYLEREGREIGDSATSYTYEWQGCAVSLDKSPGKRGFKVMLSKNGPAVSALMDGANVEYSMEDRGPIFTDKYYGVSETLEQLRVLASRN